MATRLCCPYAPTCHAATARPTSRYATAARFFSLRSGAEQKSTAARAPAQTAAAKAFASGAARPFAKGRRPAPPAGFDTAATARYAAPPTKTAASAKVRPQTASRCRTAGGADGGAAGRQAAGRSATSHAEAAERR